MTTIKAAKRRSGARVGAAPGPRRGAKTTGRPADERLSDRLDFERLLGELSAEFIQFPMERYPALIEDVQRRLCEFFGLDMSTLWESTEDDPGLFRLIQYIRLADGPPLPVPMRSDEFFPWTVKEMLAGKVVAVSSLDELPAEAVRDREVRRRFGIKSFVAVPLATGRGPIFGCLSFNTMERERVWGAETVRRLRLTAEVFANALARFRADERLRRSEERYRLLVETMSDGLIVLDERHRISYANAKVCEMLGVPESALLGRSPADHLDEKSRAVFADQLGKRMKGGHASYEVEWLAKAGRRVVTIVTPRPIFDQAGRYSGSFAVLTDITERKKAEALLRDDVQQLRNILEATSGGVWDWNIQSGAAVFSPKYARMLGYEPDEFARHYDEWGMIVHPDDIERVKQAHADHFEKGATFSVEFRMREKPGGWHWVHSRGILIERDGQDRPLRMVGTHQDIQERKNAEIESETLRNELAHANRRILVGELASSLAHELNQPLGAILNNAEAARALLEGPVRDPAELREIIADIIRDDVRAGDVIRKVRGLVKAEDKKLEPLAVGLLIQDVLGIMHSVLLTNNVSSAVELEPGLAPILGDRVQLQQVLLNLITNAIEAMRDVPGRRLLVRAVAADARTLVVSVVDSGSGLSEWATGRLFKPFQSSKPGGLGLGLPICRSIIEAHGGGIWAENNPKGGATVSFSLKTRLEPGP